MGYYLSNIFEHLRKQAIKKEENILIIQDFMNEYGWNCPKLIRSDTPDKVIAMVPAVTYEKLERIKTIIHNQEDIIDKIRALDSHIQKVEKLIKQLQNVLKKIIHDSTSFGLKGHCNIEEKLLIRYRIRHVLKFKHCKHTNPSMSN